MKNKILMLQVARTLERLARQIRSAYQDTPDLPEVLAGLFATGPNNLKYPEPLKRTASQVQELVYRKYNFKFSVTATGKALKAAGYACKAEKHQNKVYRFYYLYRW